MTTFTEHPPVPKVLQDALKDHPELIADLQKSLNRGGLRPGMSREQRTDQFEEAIWRLEDGLSHYMTEAAAEVRAAAAADDLALIAKLKEKEMLITNCRTDTLRRGVRELKGFFRWGQD